MLPERPSSESPGTELSPLAREIGKKRPFESREQEAYLNLLRTLSVLSGPFEALMRPHRLSEATYNLLRILRGAGSEGRACSRIGCDMIARVPDVTRLVDRLEASGLAQRKRSAEDRRVVTVVITDAGLGLLASLDDPVMQIHRENLGHLSQAELDELNRLLVKAREARSGSVSRRPHRKENP